MHWYIISYEKKNTFELIFHTVRKVDGTIKQHSRRNKE